MAVAGSRDHWRIVPRVLTGVASTDLSVKFSLGDHHFHWPTPVAVAPIGVQGGLSTDASNGDPRTDGDLLTATAGSPNAQFAAEHLFGSGRNAKRCAAAAKLGVSFWVSGVSSSPLEEIAEAVAAVPDAPAPWYQMCALAPTLSATCYPCLL